MGWHHEECKGKCLACLIEETVRQHYGTQGLDILRRNVGADETAQPAAWIRFCSDGTYEGPIADCDRRMDTTRRTSGAWTPLYPPHNARIQGSDAALSRSVPCNEEL